MLRFAPASVLAFGLVLAACAGGGSSDTGSQGAGARSGGASATDGSSAGTGGSGGGSCAGPVGTISGALAAGVAFVHTDGKAVNPRGGGIVREGDTDVGAGTWSE